MYSHVNLLGEGFFLTKNLARVYLSISLKRTPTQSVSFMGSAQQLFLNYENIFSKTFSNKVAVP